MLYIYCTQILNKPNGTNTLDGLEMDPFCVLGKIQVLFKLQNGNKFLGLIQVDLFLILQQIQLTF